MTPAVRRHLRQARTRTAAVRLLTTDSSCSASHSLHRQPISPDRLRTVSIGSQSALIVIDTDVRQFTATLGDGGEFDATTLAGRPAVLRFWAPT